MLSAVANAKQMGLEKENLFVKEVRVDKGIVMKRMMPAAMGTGHRINKRTSHITLVLAEKALNNKKGTKKTEETKTEVKKEDKKEIKKEVKPAKEAKPVKEVKKAKVAKVKKVTK